MPCAWALAVGARPNFSHFKSQSMTQVKLWQIVSQTPNGIVFADADGNLKSLQAAAANQLLVAGPDGAPMWADNTALTTALDAKADVNAALATAKAYTEAQIAALVNNAPLALDTLNELAVKLAQEDSAINALIAQMEGKASTTAVAALVSQTKDDVLAESNAYTDSTVSTAASNLATQIQTAKNEAVAAAAADASQKASNAQVAATQEANGYTDQRLAHELGGVAIETENKVSALRNSIPDSFIVEGTSTACFLASSSTLDSTEATGEGLLVTERFSELTGAAVAANDSSLTAKLLFINGVAASDDWAAITDGNSQLRIQMTARLAQHVFDGTENSVMLLAEYKSYNAITVKS